MLIGIDASRAFIKQRTGIEEYSYQIVKNLVDKLSDHQVILYLRSTNYESLQIYKCTNKLPDSWKIKVIRWPAFWTQVGLSLEMLFHPVDVLFVPAHTVPWIHPARNASLFSLALFIQKILKILGIRTYYNTHSEAGGPANTFVTIHGLEYEAVPEAYSFLERLYMRLSIKLSCRWVKKIIAVSKNTRKDLMGLYKVPGEKIEVVYEGVSEKFQISNSKFQINSKFKIQNSKFILFIGRLEKRKNIEGIISAFEILKKKYNIPHKLVLAGKPGYDYEATSYKLKTSSCKNDIIETGYISEGEKYNLLASADVFLFPSFYEGFGLPVLEAQAAGIPTVAGNTASLPEIGGDGAAYCDPNEPISIALSVYKLISDKSFRNGIIEKGYENAGRFSWDKCASAIADILTC